jgi:hypothetical protein
MVDRMEKIIAAGEADHEAVRLRERAAVVAWLRGMNSSHAERLADRIERGEHIKPATDGGDE